MFVGLRKIYFLCEGIGKLLEQSCLHHSKACFKKGKISKQMRDITCEDCWIPDSDWLQSEPNDTVAPLEGLEGLEG